MAPRGPATSTMGPCLRLGLGRAASRSSALVAGEPVALSSELNCVVHIYTSRASRALHPTRRVRREAGPASRGLWFARGPRLGAQRGTRERLAEHSVSRETWRREPKPGMLGAGVAGRRSAAERDGEIPGSQEPFQIPAAT